MRTAVTLLLALAILGGEAPAQQLVGQKESVFTLSERLADGGTVRIYSPLGDITITEASGNWRDRARVNITVSIPRGTRVRSGTGNGALSVNGAFADARVGSGNGRVRVTGVDGPVNASSGNGSVTVATTSGPVNASSGDGDITVSMDRIAGDGDMVLSSGNGSMEIRKKG